MIGYTDIHAHFLYGMDDGAKSREQMEAMLDAAYADGVTTLFATPHVTPGLSQLDMDTLYLHLEEARHYCRSKGYMMELHPGAEILYAPTLERFAVEKRLPTLADSSCILVEFVPDISYEEINGALEVMKRSGYDVILAHIERYDCLFKGKHIYRLKEKYGIRYQINCNSVLKSRGWWKDYHLKKWLDNELIDFVATDAHDTHNRPTRMNETYATLIKKFRAEYADKLVGRYLE